MGVAQMILSIPAGPLSSVPGVYWRESGGWTGGSRRRTGVPAMPGGSGA